MIEPISRAGPPPFSHGNYEHEILVRGQAIGAGLKSLNLTGDLKTFGGFLETMFSSKTFESEIKKLSGVHDEGLGFLSHQLGEVLPLLQKYHSTSNKIEHAQIIGKAWQRVVSGICFLGTGKEPDGTSSRLNFHPGQEESDVSQALLKSQGLSLRDNVNSGSLYLFARDLSFWGRDFMDKYPTNSQEFLEKSGIEKSILRTWIK